MTFTLLVELGVPHFLWSDAILTSTCLLNCFPLSPLGSEVPLCCLHPDRDLFALPPRVFGFVAFVHDHTPNTSKLEPRSNKGVFIGYSCTQKGYRVYFLDQCMYVVSTDVTFFESTRYFSSTFSSTTSSTISIPYTYLILFVLSSGHISSTYLDGFCSSLITLLSSPTPLINSTASPLLMPPTTSSVLISTPVSTLPPVDSLTSCSYSTPIALPSDNLHLPIALRKGKHSCTLHPISHFGSYDNLLPTYCAFSLSLNTKSIPKSHLEALKLPH